MGFFGYYPIISSGVIYVWELCYVVGAGCGSDRSGILFMGL